MDRTHIWECHANLPVRNQFRLGWYLSDIPNHMQRNACRLQQLWADQDQFLLEDHRWDCKHIAVDDTGPRLHKSASDMIVEGFSSCLRAQLTWNFLTPTPAWVTTWVDIWCLLKVLEFASWLGSYTIALWKVMVWGAFLVTHPVIQSASIGIIESSSFGRNDSSHRFDQLIIKGSPLGRYIRHKTIYQKVKDSRLGLVPSYQRRSERAWTGMTILCIHNWRPLRVRNSDLPSDWAAGNLLHIESLQLHSYWKSHLGKRQHHEEPRLSIVSIKLNIDTVTYSTRHKKVFQVEVRLDSCFQSNWTSLRLSKH